MYTQTLEQLSVAVKIVPRLTQTQYTKIMGVLKAYYGHAGRPGLVGGSMPRSGGAGAVQSPVRGGSSKVTSSTPKNLILAMEHKQWADVVHSVYEKNGYISSELLAKEAAAQGKKETSVEEWDKVTQKALKSNLYKKTGEHKFDKEHNPQTRYVLKDDHQLAAEGWGKDDKGEIYYQVSQDQSGIKKGVCFSMKVTLMGDGDAIWKGSHDQFGNPQSEEAVYKLDKLLKLGIVPESSVLQKNGEDYSIQKWVEKANSVADSYAEAAATASNRFKNSRGGFKPIDIGLKDKSAPGKVLLLDLIAGNTDRHGLNLLIQGGKIHAIDNGAAVQPFTAGILPQVIPRTTTTTLSMLKDVSLDMQKNNGRLYLPSSHKKDLEKIVKNGQLEKLFTHKSYTEEAKQAMRDRVQDLLNNWDETFHD